MNGHSLATHRTAAVLAALALPATMLVAAPGAAAASGGSGACAISADAAERIALSNGATVVCDGNRGFVTATPACAVSADAAERRAARHPGDVCTV